MSVLDVCPWCLSLMSVLDVCPWCLSLMSVLDVCPWCLSLMSVLDVCSWCLSLMSVLDVCPWCLSLMSVLDVCPWCLSLMSVLDVCPWCLSLMSVLDVCPWCLSLMSVLAGSPQFLCPALSTELNLRTIWRRQLLPSPPLACNPTSCPVPPWSRGCHSRQKPCLFQRSRPEDGVTWEPIPGLEYTGSSLPSCPSLSPTNLLYREDFPSLHMG